MPIATTLARDGHAIWGVDASPALLAAFRRNLPAMPTACEAAQHSVFFARRFDAAIAIGLVFLLDEDAQRALLARVAQALVPGGQFLFSAPRDACAWRDTLTGRPSRSLGRDAYAGVLARAGMRMIDCRRDAGGNDYHAAMRMDETMMTYDVPVRPG